VKDGGSRLPRGTTEYKGGHTRLDQIFENFNNFVIAFAHPDDNPRGISVDVTHQCQLMVHLVDGLFHHIPFFRFRSFVP